MEWKNNFSKLWKIFSGTPCHSLLPVLSLWSTKRKVQHAVIISKPSWRMHFGAKNWMEATENQFAMTWLEIQFWHLSISLLLKSLCNTEPSYIMPLGQWISHIVVIWEYMASLWREKYVTNKAREDYFILKSLLVVVIKNIRYSDFEIWKTIEFWGKITGILLRIAERTVLFNLSLNPSSDGERNSLVS